MSGVVDEERAPPPMYDDAGGEGGRKNGRVSDSGGAAINLVVQHGGEVGDEVESLLVRRGDGDGSGDSVDALPDKKCYSFVDLFCTLVSVATYAFDLSMDIIVVIYFYHLAVSHGIYHYWYFGLSLTFILLPSLTMTGFSFRWYLLDGDNDQLPPVPLWMWTLRLAALMLQVAPILRYADSIRYGLLSRWENFRAGRSKSEEERQSHLARRERFFTLMVYEDSDATLLRLFECFMESAPQLVLQIYILIRDPHAVKLNEAEIIHDRTVDPILKVSILVISIVSSLISIAWSLVVYHRSLRYTYREKKNISLAGSMVQFLWHFFSITARVLALSLFATAYPKWIGVVIAAHWAVATSWIVAQRTRVCRTRFEELLFSVVLGAIYIFSFFNAKDEPTRVKYLIYYGFCLVENTVLVALWFVSSDPDSQWYCYPSIAAHYVMFVGGVFFLLLYYGCFHPTGRRIRLSGITLKSRRDAGGDGEDEERRQKENGEERPTFLDLRETSNKGDGGEEPGINLVDEREKLRPVSPSKSAPKLDDLDGGEFVKAESEAKEGPPPLHKTVRKTSSAPTTSAMQQLQQQYQRRHRTLKSMVRQADADGKP